MNQKSQKFLIAGIILAVFVGAYVLKTTIERSAHSGQHEAGQVYICPMHPTFISDSPGDCAICGMSLIKKENRPATDHSGHEHKQVSGYATVELSPEKQRLIGIRLAEVKIIPAEKTIRTVGTIAYDPELYQAQEEYLQSASAFKKAQTGEAPEISERAGKLLASSRVKLELMGFNEALIGELEAAGVPDKTLLVSKAGETVWMYAPIYEHDLDAVKVGQRVVVTAESINTDATYEGVIRAIDPVIDPKTRSVKVRARLENPEGVLRPNVFVNSEIKVDFGNQLVIPDSAVLDSGDRKVAFISMGNGIFEPRDLKLGSKVKDAFVVLSGLNEGDRVVDQATFFIDSESKLKSVMEEGASTAGGHEGH